MASLAALAKSYRLKKALVSKLRKQSQNKLKEAHSMKRRSSSGLSTIERHKEELGRDKAHSSQLLTQLLARKDSIERLKISAEERLKQEQDALDMAKQESEYGAGDKTAALERLKYIEEKIAELHAEIKERESAHVKIVKEIEAAEKQKGKIDSQMKKQIHAKPSLLEQLKSSIKTEDALRPKVASLIRREEQASKALSVIQKKLAQALAEKRKREAKLRAMKRKARRKALARKAKSKARKKVKSKTRKKTRSKTKTRTRKVSRKARPRRKVSRKKKAAKRRKKSRR